MKKTALAVLAVSATLAVSSPGTLADEERPRPESRALYESELPSLAGPEGLRRERLRPTRASQFVWRGDLSPEIGIGCSNPTGTTGGPNDVAVYLTGVFLSQPFGVIRLTYNVFTQVSPNITEHNAAVWSSIAGSGTLIDMRPGAPFSQGNHTFAIPWPGMGPINQSSFYVGFRQPQTNAGMRWGVDTSAGGGTSFLRAPACGLSSFSTLDSIGFPGNWVFRALVDDDATPVELYDFSVE